jgi:hypothetical protein
MKFPREVWVGSHLTKQQHFPRQVVNNPEEFMKFANNYNNKMNCYTSVYDYKRFVNNRAIIHSIVLDRLFLDFDSHGKPLELSLEDMKLVVNYLVEKDHEFEMYFSGNGFHVFIFGTVSDSIRNIQQYFRQIHKLTINDTLDSSGVQTRRLRRIPNTVNMNTEECLYCIPLRLEDIESVSMITALAKNPRFDAPIRYGNRGVEWPIAPSIRAAPIEISKVKRVGKLSILPCLHNSIMVENPTHEARYYLVSWFRTILADNKKCHNEEQNKLILDKVVDELKSIASNDGIWLDWNEEITRYHAWYTINNDGGYMAPSCEKLISEGYCVGKCWRYPELN